jgi:hypothetical protein
MAGPDVPVGARRHAVYLPAPPRFDHSGEMCAADLAAAFFAAARSALRASRSLRAAFTRRAACSSRFCAARVAARSAARFPARPARYRRTRSAPVIATSPIGRPIVKTSVASVRYGGTPTPLKRQNIVGLLITWSLTRRQLFPVQNDFLRSRRHDQSSRPCDWRRRAPALPAASRRRAQVCVRRIAGARAQCGWKPRCWPSTKHPGRCSN